MSNKSNLEILTHSLAVQIKELADEFSSEHATLSDEDRTEVASKAMIEALLRTVSETNGTILGASKQHWVAIGQRSDSQATASVLGQVINELMYEDVTCNCPSCQKKRETSGVSKTQEPGVNEQTAQEILKEIEAEVVH